MLTLLNEPPKKGKGRDGMLAQYSMLAVIPALITVAPLIGYFAGQWADGELGSDPYLTILGTALGFGAGGRETYRIIRRVQKLQDEEDKKRWD